MGKKKPYKLTSPTEHANGKKVRRKKIKRVNIKYLISKGAKTDG